MINSTSGLNSYFSVNIFVNKYHVLIRDHLFNLKIKSRRIYLAFHAFSFDCLVFLWGKSTVLALIAVSLS